MLLNTRSTKSFFIFLLVILFASVATVFMFQKKNNFQKEVARNSSSTIIKTNLSQQESDFVVPLNEALSRITKKPFGIYVSPKNSPVTPEKFTGFHTGVDFETFPSEQSADISIATICGGKLLEKKQARGYGGMIVQSCFLDNLPITVVYGHIRLTSVKNSVGEILKAGDFLGFLGTGFSAETDGERKHLHLGVHRGEGIDTRGYVSTKKELEDWINVESYLLK